MGVFHRSIYTVEFEENNRILMIKKSKRCIYDSKSQPGLFLRCSYIFDQIWASLFF